MNTGMLELNLFILDFVPIGKLALLDCVFMQMAAMENIYGCLLYCPRVAWTGM